MTRPSRRFAALFGERFPLLVARLFSRVLLGLFAIALAFFALQRIVPNDPAKLLAGPGASDTAIAATRTRLGLDASMPFQFVGFLTDVASGDLGQSLRTGQPVADELRAALPFSLTLVAGAGIGGLVLGLLLALLASTERVARLPLFGLAVAGSLPIYGTAALLLLTEGRVGAFPHWAELALPAGVLGMPLAQDVARAARTSLSATFRQPYFLSARAGGRSQLGAALRHGLRNALRLPLSAFAVHAGLMVVGLLVVERLFALPGVGSYLLDAIAAGDLPASLGGCMVLAVLYLLLDVGTAVVRVLVDPRLRLE